MKTRTAALLAIGSLLLSSCSSPVATSGGGTETVVGMVMTTGNAPAAYATVVAAPEQYSTGSDSAARRYGALVPVDTVRTDVLGKFSLQLARAGAYSLEFLDSSKVQIRLLRHVQIAAVQAVRSLDTVRLAPSVKLSGIVKRALPGAYSVVLAGTQYSAAVDANGAYTFPALPADTFTLVPVVAIGTPQAGHLGMRGIRLSGVSVLADTLAQRIVRTASPGVVLVDNFEDSDAINAMGLGGSWWQFGRNGVQGVVPVKDSSWILKAGPSVDTVTLGTDMGEYSYDLEMKEAIDVSGAKGLRFRIKGTGSATLRFWSILSTDWNDPSFTIDSLTPGWRTVSIDFSRDLAPFYGGTAVANWPASFSGITCIWFTCSPRSAGQSVEMSIDDVEFLF